MKSFLDPPESEIYALDSEDIEVFNNLLNDFSKQNQSVNLNKFISALINNLRDGADAASNYIKDDLKNFYYFAIKWRYDQENQSPYIAVQIERYASYVNFWIVDNMKLKSLLNIDWQNKMYKVICKHFGIEDISIPKELTIEGILTSNYLGYIRKYQNWNRIKKDIFIWV